MHKEFSLALLKDKPVLSYIMFGLKVYDLHDLRSQLSKHPMPQTIEDSLVFNALVFLQKLKKKILHLAHQLLLTLYWQFFFFTRNYWHPQTGKHYHISGCFSDGDQSVLSFTLACNCFQSWEVCTNSGIPVQMYPSP